MRSKILFAQVTLSRPPKQGCIRQIMHCRENKLYQLSSALQYLRKALLDLKNHIINILQLHSSFLSREAAQRAQTAPKHPQNVVNLGVGGGTSLTGGNNLVGGGDSPAAEEQEADTHHGPNEWTLTPMPREWQGNVDTSSSNNITLRYCTKEEHHLLTPLPQHLISSRCELCKCTGCCSIPGPGCLPEHPCLWRCVVSPQQDALVAGLSWLLTESQNCRGWMGPLWVI